MNTKNINFCDVQVIAQNEPHVQVCGKAGQNNFFMHEIDKISQLIDVYAQPESFVQILVHDDVVNLDDFDEQAICFNLYIARNALVVVYVSLANVARLNLNINIALQETQAHSKIFGVYALSNDQNISIKIVQHHQVVQTTSLVRLHGLLQDRVSLKFEGLIRVDQSAQKSHAQLMHKNLSQGAQALVISQPSLEIEQPDIVCCHGTAMGQIDEQQLWYLQTKGVTHLQAKRLLMHAFLNEVVKEFPDSEKRMRVLCEKMA